VLAEVGYSGAEIAELHARGCVHDRAATRRSATSVG
jgi:hypothetical protein